MHPLRHHIAAGPRRRQGYLSWPNLDRGRAGRRSRPVTSGRREGIANRAAWRVRDIWGPRGRKWQLRLMDRKVSATRRMRHRRHSDLARHIQPVPNYELPTGASAPKKRGCPSSPTHARRLAVTIAGPPVAHRLNHLAMPSSPAERKPRSRWTGSTSSRSTETRRPRCGCVSAHPSCIAPTSVHGVPQPEATSVITAGFEAMSWSYALVVCRNYCKTPTR